MVAESAPNPTPHLIDPLTTAEEKVLKLLAQGLSDKEIGIELSIAPITVRGDHKQNIYDKLGLQPGFRNRKWAVHCARQLGLLSSAEGDSEHPPPGDNPYRGLDVFQQQDAHLFFGREAFIEHLTTSLSANSNSPRFIAVVGPSGSGKSSIVRAGLIPTLHENSIPDASTWTVATMFPRVNPFHELEAVLQSVAIKHYPDVLDLLQRDAYGLVRAMRLILPEGRALLLIVDQFEELFTLVEDRQLARHFMDLLYAAVTDPLSSVWVIITLRADFLDRPLMYPDFSWLVQEHTAMVVPMSPDELERAITCPAQQAHVTFEPGLVARLVAEANEQPGALPLLEFALTELYDNRIGHTITMNTYNEIGGFREALTAQADRVYHGLFSAHQEAVRQVFLRLITLGEGTEDIRRRVPVQELQALDYPTPTMEYTTQFLAANRLLTLDLDPTTRLPTVEVAHEALIREWKRLQGWLDESRNDVRMERMLATAVDEWHRHDRDESYLMRGAKLAQFAGWRDVTNLALTVDENHFVDASLRERDRQRHRRRLMRNLALTVTTLVSIVMAVLALWALDQRGRAELAEHDALQQASIGLAAQAELELMQGVPERGILIALEALEDYPYTWQAERALFAAVQQTRLIHELHGHTDRVFYALWSPDGTRLLTVGYDGRTRLWDAASGVTALLDEHDAALESGAWSPDGTRIATVSLDGTVKVFDTDTHEMLLMLTEHTDQVWWAAWSPGGTQIATASLDGTARVWDADTGQTLLILSDHDAAVFDVAWSPDGRRIATASFDGTARIWNVDVTSPASGESLLLMRGHTDKVRQVTWSPDGKRIATASFDSTARIWDANSGEELFVLSRDMPGKVHAAKWSPDGKHLLTVQTGGPGTNGVATIWDTETGVMVFSLPGSGPLNFGAWSPDGTRVAVSDVGIFTRVWDATTGDELFVLYHTGVYVGSPDWSPDGTRLATTNEVGTVFVWDTTDAALLTFEDQYQYLAAWSPDGRQFARADSEGPLHITDRETGAIALTLPPVGSRYNGASWSPDGKSIATSHEDGTVRIWNAVSGAEQLVFQTEHPVYAPRWSPDGERISLTTYWAGIGYVYDATNGEQLFAFDAGESRGDLVWSPDGTQLASAIWHAGQVIIRDATSGERIRTIAIGGFLIDIDWSPDGTRLAIATGDNLAHIVDAHTGEILLTYAGHNNWVIKPDWSPDGSRIATAGEDSVRIWDPVTGAEYGVLDVTTAHAQWSSDGTRLLTVGGDSVVRIWQVFPTTDSLIDYAHVCCVFRQLTPEERAQFGLPMREK